MLRIIVYAVLFILGYRVLKRFFAPDFGQVDRKQEERPQFDPFEQSQRNAQGKSNVVEDVDYEEIDSKTKDGEE